MSNENQPRQANTKELEVFLVLASMIIAWPALFLGVIARWQIKQRTIDPFPYWIGAGTVGTIGAMVLVTWENPYPFLLAVLHDLVPLIMQMGMPTFTHFLRDVIPVWERSILVFPWFLLLVELFSPKNLQASLLATERRSRAIQASKSKRAARKARNAPDQINGKGVLGVLIDNPNK